MKDNKSTRIAILGAGKTGFSIANYYQDKNIECQIFAEGRGNESLVTYGDFSHKILKEFSCVIISPGVGSHHKIYSKLIDNDIPVSSDIDIFMQECQKDIILITGTNGKSTLVSMCEHVARSLNINAIACGNNGYPVLDALRHDYDLYIIEISSFQLQLARELKSKRACILNISNDHLFEHGNFENYKNIKHKIYQNTNRAVHLKDSLVNSNLDMSTLIDEDYSFDEKEIYYKSQPIINLDKLPLKGAHNYLNAIFCVAMLDFLPFDRRTLISKLINYKTLKHRTEYFLSYNDITWINDAKATNIDATIKAIQSIDNCKATKYLILGGISKEYSFKALQEYTKDYNLLIFGHSRALIKQSLPDSIEFNTLLDIIKYLKENLNKNSIVLFSPACASFDSFKNYSHRGNYFKDLVHSLCT